MSSLQEQLLKAGLVDKNRATKVAKEKHKQARVARNKPVGGEKPAISAAQKQRDKRLERDRELNQQRQQAAAQKALIAQIKQLIELNQLDRSKAELPYSFVYKKKVKKLYVDVAQQKQLALGKLAIVTLVNKSGRMFELVPQAVAQKIAERDAPSVVQLGSETTSAVDGDDPYADFQVPDDLIW